MPFIVSEIHEDPPHQWAVVTCKCELNNEYDPLLQFTVTAVREAYGEHELVPPSPDPSVAATFNLDAIMNAFRMGLPNPEVEANKNPSLSTYRSETCELVARDALSAVYDIRFPTAPQRGKTNANQPILGFDGWGFWKTGTTDHTLVLIQVKGTDEDRCPPTIARALAEECRRLPNQESEICRALTVLAQLLRNTDFFTVVLRMLEKMGSGNLPRMVVAPVIVRGTTPPHVDDLKPIRDVFVDLTPNLGKGIAMSISVDLNEFGKVVMDRARSKWPSR